MTIKTRQRIFTYHGIRSELIGIRLYIIDEFITADTGEQGYRRVDVTEWSRERILNYLGY